jgi:hypothetical protein
MSDPVESLARRVEGNPFFLASLLALYARSENLDETGLAAALGCRPDDLTDLRLCRAPHAEPRPFWDDITRIAGHFGLDPNRLAEVVRRGQAIQRAKSAATGAPDLLAAARDAPPPADEAEGSP